MHIVFDGRALDWTGIGRYTRNLLEQYKQLFHSHTFTVLVPQELVSNVADEFSSDTFHNQPIESSYYTWREQLVLWRQLEAIEADLFHFPHFNVPIFFRKPYVATIHDATRFIFPSQKRSSALEQMAYEYVFARTIKQARAIISVTHHTAEQIHRLPLPKPSSMKVIYEGVSEEFRPDVPSEDRARMREYIHTSSPYLLYVGVWMAHKNLVGLLSAFKQVLQTHPEIQLVITGKPVAGHIDIRPYAKKLGIENNVRFVGFVPHKMLPALYADSTGFVFPSLYEGFGLPPLEAAASGVPVVASEVSSIPEIMGKAAEYVNPESVESITEGITRILEDTSLREKYIQAGFERARQFRWDTCAHEHLKLYEEIV